MRKRVNEAVMGQENRIKRSSYFSFNDWRNKSAFVYSREVIHQKKEGVFVEPCPCVVGGEAAWRGQRRHQLSGGVRVCAHVCVGNSLRRRAEELGT